ncbi:MAG: undecaprenyl-phosphate alpha-N-acetylglucosaminyltransferase [uncultured bacterium]|nr:MAG: undecaprenyl-phosphate alpha-N-acetylglucosaminyltransferase [uncultured bacterium]
MEYVFFLQPLILSFSIASLLLAGIVVITRRLKIIDKRISARHVHHFGISRFGGIALIASFFLATLFDDRLVLTGEFQGILLACLAILLFGVMDDVFELGWKWQLLFQISVAVFVYFMGIKLEYISNPFGGIYMFDSGFPYLLGFSFSVLWIVFLMNAVNWVDGVDGVSGGITLIAAGTIFMLSLKPEVNQPPMGIIAAALVGALVAFLIYNFYPAKIMAGTSGSMFLGFILAVLAIFAGAKIATTLMVLAVPVVDALWVIGERLHLKKSIFSADRRHLHFKLLKLGWSVRKICMFYYALTLLIAILALNMRALGKVATMTIVAGMLISVMAVLAKRSIRHANDHE